MNVKICQLRPKLGDIAANLSMAVKEIRNCCEDVICFSELFLIGYPPTDEVFIDNFEDKIKDAVAVLTAESHRFTGLIIMGTPFFDRPWWRNAALCIHGGRIIHTHYKCCLPNYDIFNENRYFEPGKGVDSFIYNNKKMAVLICEDIWGNVSPQYYAVDPVTSLINQDLDQIFHISASPFERKKMAQRVAQLKRVATLCCTTVLSVNQVGGYTELLFDGHSVSVDKNNVVNYHSYPFEVGVFNSRQSKPFVFDSIKEIETAIVFGITEYVRQSGYTAVVMGVSGGLDSAVVAALAVRALGKKKVTLISLPSQFNSDETKNDARLLANRLGAAFNEVSIEEYRRQMDHSLALEWGDLNDLCRQNIQARIRGVILMAMSNQTNALLLSTGNKSELAMGYATLYGDMCGALNPIGDVYKTQVVELANWINQPNEIIPQRIIDRPPSAELAFNQRDDDTLPPYADLDRILDQRINQGYSVHELCEMNDNKTVEFVLKRLKKNEFKRFQSPPILRLSNKSFGRGWHFPLVY